MNNEELEPLRPKSASFTGEKKFYFLQNRTPTEERKQANSGDEPTYQSYQAAAAAPPPPPAAPTQSVMSWFNPFYWRARGNSQKPRKVPVKVEPKVFFANERTFLAWLHMSVTLASISIAIVAFADANAFSQIYGFILMPVAIAFCIYSLWIYMKRASMIRRRDPGPYDDRVGPVVLSALLGLSIVVNFVVKLYDFRNKQ